MSLMLDHEYAGRVGLYIEKFTKLRSGQYIGRCPICGDSKKSKTKRRFYIKENGRGTGLYVKCYNCQYFDSLRNFMKDYYEDLYKEYLTENFKHNREWERVKRKPVKITSIKTKVLKSKTDKYIYPLKSLPDDHPAKDYLRDRKIPENQWVRLAYSPDFIGLCRTFDPKFYENVKVTKKSERLVIPYIDKDNGLIAFQGRALDKKDKMRYITFTVKQTLKVFGEDVVDRNKKVYCTEAPLDSLFIPNCIATGDSNLTAVEADVYIFDNQPKNKELVKLMEDAIKDGKSIVIWPESMVGKDINEFVENGLTPEQVLTIIDNNTFTGTFAKLQLSKWRKSIGWLIHKKSL